MMEVPKIVQRSTTPTPIKNSKLEKYFEKKFVTANELLEDSFRLAKKIKESKFIPTWIIALWRGGSLIGCCVQEYFKYYGHECDHIAIRTSHYNGIGKKKNKISVHNLHYLVENGEYSDRLLIVDDVFDTGKSVKKVLKEIKKKMRRNCPKEIKVGVVFYKPERNQTNIVPDFYVHDTKDWLVFPHELEGLKDKEIKKKGGDILDIVKKDKN